MKILNFGSINIDYVYKVNHIARPGETISSTSFAVFAGGKGANQSVALAKAGADVYHAGKIGTDGQWVIDKLQGYGVGTDFIQSCDSASGHAIIQVDSDGRNAIVLYPGCNKMFTRREIDMTLGNFATDSILLLQNEINEVPYLIQEAHKRGMEVCLNPAPFDMAVRNYPLTEVDILIVNEIESMELAGVTKITEALEYLEKILPDTEIVITLGEKGATY